jgi:hypothetical protein
MIDAVRRKTFHVLDTPSGPELRFGSLDGFSFEGDVYRGTIANLALWLNGLSIDVRMSSPSHDRAMAEGGWQPMSTAPKTGMVLLHRPNFADSVVAGVWSRYFEWWDLGWGCLKTDYFDAWQPLPASPTPTTKEETDK